MAKKTLNARADDLAVKRVEIALGNLKVSRRGLKMLLRADDDSRLIPEMKRHVREAVRELIQSVEALEL